MLVSSKNPDGQHESDSERRVKALFSLKAERVANVARELMADAVCGAPVTALVQSIYKKIKEQYLNRRLLFR